MNHKVIIIFFAFCFISLTTQQWAAASDNRLPDGTEFSFWEQPLQFSRTYFVDCNSPKADDNGPGTSEQPFRTINKAAQILQPGERVVIASGVYRECVRPASGGADPNHMISYEAAPGAKVFIRGSEDVSKGWERSTSSTTRGRGGAGGQAAIWKYQLKSDMFPDMYNPFALPSIAASWGWLNTKIVDMGPYLRKRGLVFVNGKPLEPMEQTNELGNTPLRSWIPTPPPAEPPTGRGGMPPRTPGGAIMQEIGGSPDARFAVESSGNIIYIRVPDNTPANPLIEITIREQVFVPTESGMGYIRIKGLTFQHAGNGYPPPQHGLVSTNGGHHWIIEDNTIEWANGVGLDIGSGGGGGGRSGSGSGAGSSHVIRGNTIRYCGVCGICGQGTQNVLVENNTFEWIGWADAEREWESGAIKFHNATNMLLRRNVIRHIRHANAVWYDVGNTNCRVTANVMADVLSVSAAVHMEMTRNYNLIDNNIIWNVRNAEPGTPGQRGSAGSGFFIHATDRVVIAQNIIGYCDNLGVYPVLRPDRGGSGTGIDNHIYNNIFTNCGNGAIQFLDKNNRSDGNVYVSLKDKFLGFSEGETTAWLDLPQWRDTYGWDANSVTLPMNIDFDPDTLELTMDGKDLPNVAILGKINTDMYGKETGDKRAPGPFADPAASTKRLVDPRTITAAKN
ncbi:MAG: right-handed parallel beta-helix repeat-containing protein [Sedimentisphaerales bacterium]|nr:right-handed parallel beta-helix repeat-containing protein [Sedimentisphaerales bacterium]